jgi:predicted PurR-regulated permease PerM
MGSNPGRRPRPGHRPPIGAGRPRLARRAARPADGVPPGLRTAAGYAWRLVLLGLTAYLVVDVLTLLELPVIALFLAQIVTSVLRPLVDLLARAVPRPFAVLAAFLTAGAVVTGVLTLVVIRAAGEWGHLGTELRGGLTRIDHWLAGAPFHLRAGTVTDLRSKLDGWVTSHRSMLVSTALSGASRLVEVVTVLALALFCSVFFLHSGDRMWHWAVGRLPARSQPSWQLAGRAAWRAFAGYTRGILIVSAVNATLVGIALLVLDVPLALPLTVLEFVATLVPLVGSPVALAVAAVVALASRGPVVALVVLALIVVIGQIEGHLLHPLVMGWSVRLHPVAVALSVTGGAVLAGVVGAVVSVPVVSVAWAVVHELREPSAPARPDS